jgi:hypothetical protein
MRSGMPPQPMSQRPGFSDGCNANHISFRDSEAGSETRHASGEGTKEIRLGSNGAFTTFEVVRGAIPPELLPGLARDFTQEERDAIYSHVNKSIAPSVPQPAALFVVGPSAVGKSVLSHASASVLFGASNNAVMIDGAEFREVHALPPMSPEYTIANTSTFFAVLPEKLMTGAAPLRYRYMPASKR